MPRRLRAAYPLRHDSLRAGPIGGLDLRPSPDRASATRRECINQLWAISFDVGILNPEDEFLELRGSQLRALFALRRRGDIRSERGAKRTRTASDGLSRMNLVKMACFSVVQGANMTQPMSGANAKDDGYQLSGKYSCTLDRTKVLV
jgi:hypothetical protein